MEFVFLLVIAGLAYFLFQYKNNLAAAQKRLKETSSKLEVAEAEVTRLRPYQVIPDAEARAREITAAAEGFKLQTETNAASTLSEADARAKAIVQTAQVEAQAIAGAALEAKDKAKLYEDAVVAARNTLAGYGNQYIIPTYSLLDDLAEEFAFTDAGEKLKEARKRSKTLSESGNAAVCDYAEANRRIIAVRFVTDAFNGKVDSILARTKSDNFGTLKQQITDAFNLVNVNGQAFRNAKVTAEYRDARIDELKWAAIAFELKEKDREEQRAIKDKIREEQRAQKEFEKALKDAAKEEEMLKKAMEKVQAQVAAASDAEREKFQAKLAELQEQLTQAEQKNQRALSMAQQTRTGHVYVISNIGSFGEHVLKIGMTRRLEPLDRIKELGDASVPFEFDVHAMIFSEDAPALEKALHKHFLRTQINKVNPRKEFFRIPLNLVQAEIEALGHKAHWTITSLAREYRESLVIEQEIQSDPLKRQEWLHTQIDAVDADTSEEPAEGIE